MFATTLIVVMFLLGPVHGHLVLCFLGGLLPRRRVRTANRFTT